MKKHMEKNMRHEMVAGFVQAVFGDSILEIVVDGGLVLLWSRVLWS